MDTFARHCTAVATALTLAAGGALVAAPPASANELTPAPAIEQVADASVGITLHYPVATTPFGATGALTGETDPDVSVVATDRDGNVVDETLSSNDGYFTLILRGLTPGVHVFTVQNDLGASATGTWYVIQFGVDSTDIFITEGETAVVTGKAMPGVLTVLDEAGAEFGRGDAAAPDGRFSLPIDGLGAGVHELFVTDARGEQHMVRVHVTAAVVEVTPLAPTLEDSAVVLPEVAGVDYVVTDNGDGTFTVIATPQDGYVFTDGAQTEWTLSLPTIELPEVERPGGELPELPATDGEPASAGGQLASGALAATGGDAGLGFAALGTLLAGLGVGAFALTRRRRAGDDAA